MHGVSFAQLVKTCAKLFGLKNMDAWISCLDADSEVARPENGETVAANCMLIAEATSESILAMIAYQKGALPALKKVLALWTPVAKASGNGAWSEAAAVVAASSSVGADGKRDGGKASKRSYAGQPAVERALRGAMTAIENIEALVRESMAMQATPAGEAAPLAAGKATWRNVFKGDFINVRAEPNVASAVVARLPPGALLTAEAEHGGWLRLVGSEEEGVPPSSWVLVRHPVHGALLEPVT